MKASKYTMAFSSRFIDKMNSDYMRLTGMIVHHDAYYACDWKKLVSHSTVSESPSPEDEAFEEWWPLMDSDDSDVGIEEQKTPSKLGSAFSIPGEIYREIEALGDPSDILKYFRPLIIYWKDPVTPLKEYSVGPPTKIFDNNCGYSVRSFSPPGAGYPFYRVIFDFIHLNPPPEIKLLTARSYIPDPREFYSQPDLKMDSAAPIPFIKLPSYSFLVPDIKSGSLPTFKEILLKAAEETEAILSSIGGEGDSDEIPDNLNLLYAGITSIVPIPDLSANALDNISTAKDSLSWIQADESTSTAPYQKLKILHKLLITNKVQVNEIYGNSYNEDIKTEIIELNNTVEALVEQGILATLDIYSY